MFPWKFLGLDWTYIDVFSVKYNSDGIHQYFWGIFALVNMEDKKLTLYNESDLIYYELLIGHSS